MNFDPPPLHVYLHLCVSLFKLEISFSFSLCLSFLLFSADPNIMNGAY